MDAERKAKADAEAKAKRATDVQVLADAEGLIAAWNERQRKGMPMLFAPTIGAAIAAGYWFLWVRCRTSIADEMRIEHTRRVLGESIRGAGSPVCPVSLRFNVVCSQKRFDVIQNNRLSDY